MIRELVQTDDIRRAYRVVQQLRPHLGEDEFVSRVLRQRSNGYRLVGVDEDGVVKAVAGFRLREMLFQGRHLYIDDLVTDESERSKGYGSRLMTWLKDVATREGCATLELDSGVQRFRAHAFYFDFGMHIATYHFTLSLKD